MKTKFAIGCLVQWYEIDIVSQYIDSLINAIDSYSKDHIIVDITFTSNQDLETISEDKTILDIYYEFYNELNKLNSYTTNINFTDNLTTISDYRREFNTKYCEEVDLLFWGESDMLVPKQAFIVLDHLHSSQSKQTPKYLATFGICKMWDRSWEILEHPEFSLKEHSDSKEDWWGVNYDMSIDEMNSFNDKVEELEVITVHPHKFNGCGLVISSEVIKSGVNIPQSAFFIHEDTAFMLMTQKVLGNIPQYHFKNLLVVHNRKHKDKRNYIKGETGATVGQKRNSNKWYTVANKLCEQNVYNMFNPAYKAANWNDVWKSI